MKTVYKIVLRDPGGRLLSPFISGKAAIEYIPGEWIGTPEWLASRGYYPLAYKSFEAAFGQAAPFAHLQVWEAEALLIIERDNLPPPLCLKSLKAGSFKQIFVTWPIDTVMVPKIRLIRPCAAFPNHPGE